MAWLKKHLLIIIALTIALFAARTLLTSHHYYTHDDIQVFRVSEFVECVKSWQIPCRWANNLGKGYGYPWFNYYPPAIYIVPSMLHLAGLPIITSINLFVFATFFLAAWSMYKLVSVVARDDSLALLASAMYTMYPFHAVNVFVRGVLAENLAWSFAPLFLLLIYSQIAYKRTSHYLPALFATLFLTHIISSFVLTGLSIFWAVLVAWSYRQRIFPVIGKLILQIVFGITLSAFFFAPALLEKNLVQSDSLTQGYYRYDNHYVSFYQLFGEYKWNYGSSLWGELSEEMPFMVGHVHVALLLIGICVAVLSYTKIKRKSQLYLGLGLVIPVAGFLLLAHSRSDPIWSLIPPLAYIQFPWRFVVWAGLPLILSGVILLGSASRRLRHILVVLFLPLTFFYSITFFHPRSLDNLTDYDLIYGRERVEQQGKSLFDYLPVTVHEIPDVPASQSSADYPVFYFPGWTASDQTGANVPIGPDPISGLITPMVPTDQELTLRWGETPLRLLADIISLFSLVLYLYYLSRSHVQ